ncbi:PadR family transcriptional regulator [Edaphobacter aggregans]|uniref:PadR family transcriptional regulator n=1 Tax=Edaphobacter aggregans TaxID=570835 RepID=UPI00054F77F4|nr:PadR family transcriptional regulator [Edaphobacter aggregans]
MARESNPNFLNGVPELLVLRLLEDEERYGYEIVQAIRRGTGEVITAGEGVVYPLLHGLEQEGAVRSKRRTVNGRSRVYYSLTPAGRRRLEEMLGAWRRVAGAIETMLTGGRDCEAIS